MSINLLIKDAHKSDLIEFYSIKKKQLQDELRSIEEILEQLGGKKEGRTVPSEPGAAFSKSNGDRGSYNPNWVWWRKIQHILSEVEGGLTTTEIVAKILEYEPGLNDERLKVVRSISSVLSTTARAKNSLLLRYVNDRGDFLYDLRKKMTAV